MFEQRRKYLAHRGIPPLADKTGAAKAHNASFITPEAAKALPQRIKDDRPMSATANPTEA
jgi:hypothetical protein